jgi:hypothetical protein
MMNGELDTPKSIHTYGTWWCGLAGVVAGAIGDFAALAFASQALVAALGGATTLATNLLVAKYWQKETLTKFDIAGCGLVAGGAVITALLSKSTDAYSLPDLLSCSRGSDFQVFLFVQVIVLLGLLGSIASSQCYSWRERLTNRIAQPIVRRIQHQEQVVNRRLVTYVQQLEMRVQTLEKDTGDLKRQQSALTRSMISTEGSAASGGGGGEHGRAPSAADDELAPPTTDVDSLIDSHIDIDRYRKWNDNYVYAACSVGPR